MCRVSRNIAPGSTRTIAPSRLERGATTVTWCWRPGDRRSSCAARLYHSRNAQRRGATDARTDAAPMHARTLVGSLCCAWGARVDLCAVYEFVVNFQLFFSSSISQRSQEFEHIRPVSAPLRTPQGPPLRRCLDAHVTDPGK